MTAIILAAVAGAAAGATALVALLPASLRRPVLAHLTERRIAWRDRAVAGLVRAMERRP